MSTGTRTSKCSNQYEYQYEYEYKVSNGILRYSYSYSYSFLVKSCLIRIVPDRALRSPLLCERRVSTAPQHSLHILETPLSPDFNTNQPTEPTSIQSA
eukprot:scaffold659221_cov79-Prasinocladus_malaysianus.AAC.1